MIDIKQAGGRYWISSVDLYDRFGREKDKYYRWVKKCLVNNCSIDQNIDYYVFKTARNGWLNPNRTEYYISIPVALGICIGEGTITSRNIRRFIQKEMKDRATKNYIRK